MMRALVSVKYAKVTGRKKVDDSAYGGWAAEKIWVKYVTANPCDNEAGDNPDATTTLNIMASDETDPSVAPIGHTEASLPTNEIISYVATPNDATFDGYLAVIGKKPYPEVAIA